VSLKSRIKSLFMNAGTGATNGGNFSQSPRTKDQSDLERFGTTAPFDFKSDIHALSAFKTIARGNTPRVLLLASERGAHLERVCRRIATVYKPAVGFFVIQQARASSSAKFSDCKFLRLTLNGNESPTLTFEIDSQYETLIELLRFLEIELVHVRYTLGDQYPFLGLLKELKLPFNLEVQEAEIDQLATDDEAMNDYKWLSNNCKQLSAVDLK
jgi:hypothetical protein